MKGKILNIGLILASFIGYLEWGGNNSMFLFQGEIEILSKLFSDPLSAIHPFTLLPLIGQLLLLVTLFQKSPSKMLSFFGLGCIGILFVFMFAIGAIGFNLKILGSTVPFLGIGVLVIRHHRKKRSNS